MGMMNTVSLTDSQLVITVEVGHRRELVAEEELHQGQHGANPSSQGAARRSLDVRLPGLQASHSHSNK